METRWKIWQLSTTSISTLYYSVPYHVLAVTVACVIIKSTGTLLTAEQTMGREVQGVDGEDRE